MRFDDEHRPRPRRLRRTAVAAFAAAATLTLVAGCASSPRSPAVNAAPTPTGTATAPTPSGSYVVYPGPGTAAVEKNPMCQMAHNIAIPTAKRSVAARTCDQLLSRATDPVTKPVAPPPVSTRCASAHHPDSDGGRPVTGARPADRRAEVLDLGHAAREIVYFTDVVAPHLALVALGPGPDGKGSLRLLLSTDGGATFHDIGPRTPPEMMPDSVFVLDPDNIWLDAADQGGGAEILYRTTNGGRNWQRSPAPGHTLNAGATSALDFTSPDSGWLAQIEPTAPDEQIYRTTDSGRSWQQIASTRTQHAPFDLGTVHFEPAGRVGWLAGGAFSGALDHTSDGGRTWHKTPIPAASGRFGAPALFGTTLVEPVTTLGSCQEQLTIWTSTTGGTNWTASPPLTIPLATKYSGQTVSTSFPAADDGWASVVDAHGVAVFRTTDRGRHWTQLALPTLPKAARHYPPVIQAADATHAWLTVMGPSPHGKSVYATIDGGHTWRRLTLP